MLSDKIVGRLSLYRRLLRDTASQGKTHIYSHELARLAGCTPAQVRRDIMALGYSGSPAHGYECGRLAESISAKLDPGAPQAVALFGVGNLGRAMLAHFSGRMSGFAIVAAFDLDPQKVNRVIHGCRCYPMEEMDSAIAEKGVKMAMLTLPPDQAQGVADRLYWAGIRGFVNFAPVRLRLPYDAYVENVDMTMSLERVAYFACGGRTERST